MLQARYRPGDNLWLDIDSLYLLALFRDFGFLCLLQAPTLVAITISIEKKPFARRMLIYCLHSLFARGSSRFNQFIAKPQALGFDSFGENRRGSGPLQFTLHNFKAYYILTNTLQYRHCYLNYLSLNSFSTPFTLLCCTDEG